MARRRDRKQEGPRTKIYRDLMENALSDPERTFDEIVLRMVLYADCGLLFLQRKEHWMLEGGVNKLNAKLMEARAHIHQAVNIIAEYRGKPVDESWRSHVPQMTSVPEEQAEEEQALLTESDRSQKH